ncbi:MAG: exonuclease SbcCD subunit D [Chloroflexi bacterium]|nr:exonuclease SbcCD subunit D [Chloroflexota bacterium]
MSEPIRVLHFADVHIGMENYGKIDSESGLSRRVHDYLRRIDEMIEHARERDVDLVVFAGDAFRSRNPDPTQQRAFAQRIRALAHLAPTALLVGNHDLPVNAAKASTMDIYHTLDVPNIWVALDYELRRISTKRGDVIVGAAPYPVRARLLGDDSRRGLTIAEQDAKLERILGEKLAELAGQAESLADETTPRLLVGHFSVEGAVWGSERLVMLGRDVTVDLEALADPRWDYVALGHIHRHQNLRKDRRDAPPVVYCGSPERIDFGEEAEAKGFCWVELARDRADWQFIESKARAMRTLRVDCRDVDNPTRQVIGALKEAALDGAIVRLELRLTPESEALLDESAIIEALKRAGVFHIAGMRKDVERGAGARLGRSPEGLSPLELLERYFEIRGVDEARRGALLERARDIVKGGMG